MYTILFVWFASMAFCGFITFVLPGWDAWNRRKANRTAPIATDRSTGRNFAQPTS